MIAGHLRLQLIERDVEIVRDMRGRDELPEVLEAGALLLQIRSGREERLKTRRKVRVARQLIADGWAASGRRRMRILAVISLRMIDLGRGRLAVLSRVARHGRPAVAA